MCGQPIRTVYYETGGNVVCAPCRGKLESEIGSAGKGGRLLRASALGLVAAAAGSAVYYGIAAATDSTWGIVAILVGFLVGKGVFIGSGRRGGRGYQFLALGLTYFAIASSYIPLARHELKKNIQQAQKDSALVFPDRGAAASDSPGIASEEATPSRAKPPKTGRKGFVGALLLVAGLLLLSAVLPILVGLASPITVLILVFGLLQAWRMNKGVVLSVTGPYRLAPASTATAEA
jgi:hypothetical protein